MCSKDKSTTLLAERLHQLHCIFPEFCSLTQDQLSWQSQSSHFSNIQQAGLCREQNITCPSYLRSSELGRGSEKNRGREDCGSSLWPLEANLVRVKEQSLQTLRTPQDSVAEPAGSRRQIPALQNSACTSSVRPLSTAMDSRLRNCAQGRLVSVSAGVKFEPSAAFLVEVSSSSSTKNSAPG